MASGLALTVIGLTNRSLAGLLLAGIGGCLAYQYSDSCNRWSDQPAKLAQTTTPHTEDFVDEAGAQSFPASDPPANSISSVW